MAAPLTREALCNRALAKFGGGAILSLDDATPPGPQCRLVYDNTLDWLFSFYPWIFTKEVRALTPLVVTPNADGFLPSGWRYAFALPTNLLELPGKYLRDPAREGAPVERFAIMDETIYADEAALWAVCRLRKDEARWPPYFVVAAVACLAAELVMPVSGNSGLLENLQAQAWGTPQEGRRGGLLGLAMQADARNGGGQAVNIDGFIRNWRNG